MGYKLYNTVLCYVTELLKISVNIVSVLDANVCTLYCHVAHLYTLKILEDLRIHMMCIFFLSEYRSK